MDNHKVGDLVIRYYFQANILGYIKRVNNTKDFMYEIDWIDPPDGVDLSHYDFYEIHEAKRRLSEFLKSQTR